MLYQLSYSRERVRHDHHSRPPRFSNRIPGRPDLTGQCSASTRSPAYRAMAPVRRYLSRWSLTFIAPANVRPGSRQSSTGIFAPPSERLRCAANVTRRLPYASFGPKVASTYPGPAHSAAAWSCARSRLRVWRGKRVPIPRSSIPRRLDPKPGVSAAVYDLDLGPTYLTTHQIAKMVGASPSTVLSWVDRGWLVAHRTPGGHRRVERAALLSFLRVHSMPVPRDFDGAHRALLVMADPGEAEALRQGVTAHGSRVLLEPMSGLVTALIQLAEPLPDALILDDRLQGFDLLSVARELRNHPLTRHLRLLLLRPQPGRSDGAWLAIGNVSLLDFPPEPEAIVRQLTQDFAEPISES